MLLKKIIPCLVAAFLVACGDDGGNSTSPSESTSESDKATKSAEESSSSLTIPEGWDWNVPKETRLNPEITYDSMTDSRDGKTYKTVKIGDQTWMAENLNYADSARTESLRRRSWCYENVKRNCEVAGRLYTWAAAIDSVKLANDADNPQDCGYGKTCILPAKVRGICPSGWHLPTEAEWISLFNSVGGSSTVGMVLKSQSGWYNNGNGTDAFGFSALPAGNRDHERDSNRSFLKEGNYASFWSSTESEYSSSSVCFMYLYYDDDDARLDFGQKDYGFSVRCLKD